MNIYIYIHTHSYSLSRVEFLSSFRANIWHFGSTLTFSTRIRFYYTMAFVISLLSRTLKNDHIYIFNCTLVISQPENTRMRRNFINNVIKWIMLPILLFFYLLCTNKSIVKKIVRWLVLQNARFRFLLRQYSIVFFSINKADKNEESEVIEKSCVKTCYEWKRVIRLSWVSYEMSVETFHRLRYTSNYSICRPIKRRFLFLFFLNVR